MTPDKPLTEDRINELVNTFIRKQCSESYAHLIDTDDNDGQKLRQGLLQLVQSSKRLYKGFIKRQIKIVKMYPTESYQLKYALLEMKRLKTGFDIAFNIPDDDPEPDNVTICPTTDEENRKIKEVKE